MIYEEFNLLTLEDLFIDNHPLFDFNYVILNYNFINFTFDENTIDLFAKSVTQILKTKYRNRYSLYENEKDFYEDFKSILIANIDTLINAMLVTELQLTIETINKANAVSTEYVDNRNIDKLFSSSIENFRKTAESPTEIEAINDFVDSYTNFQEKTKTDNNVTKDNAKDDRSGNIVQSNTGTFEDLFNNIENLKFGYINKLVSELGMLFVRIYDL